MTYSQVVIRVLEHIASQEGTCAGIANRTSAASLVEAVSDAEDPTSVRIVRMAMTELIEAGMVQVGRTVRTSLGTDSIEFIDMDVTGPGLRFLESLRVQAKAEGQSKSWFWSGVEKAANLGQLVNLVVQAAASSMS